MLEIGLQDGRRSRPHRPAPPRRYAVAPLAIAIAVLVRLPLHGSLGEAVPFVFYFPAVGATAWIAGLGPGLLATALAIAAALYVVPGLAFGVLPTASLIGLPLFAVVGAFVSILTANLQRERATLETTLLSIADGIIVTDAEGRLTLMNAMAERLTGWPAGEAHGRPLADVFQVRRPDGAAADLSLERIRRGEAGLTLDPPLEMRRRDGALHPVDATIAPVRDGGGRLDGVVIVCRDDAARRQAAAEREAMLARERAARLEAEAASRVRDEFLATLSHELRTPLNAILGWARLLGTGALDAGRATQAVQVIERNAESQERLITDLLDVSRFASGKMRLAAELVDLRAVVADAIDALRLAADAKELSIVFAADGAPPRPVGDADRLRQLAWNLIANAVKFTPRGGTIVVRLEAAAPHVALVVRDTGAGISAEFLPHVFDRFAQEDVGTARQHGGMGLGLALVRQIAEAHGGTVQAESDGPGCGATFTVILPVAAGRAAARHPSGAHAAAGGAARLDGRRVVLVDDDADGLALAEALLTDAGAEVRACRTAQQALATLATWPADVVVTDIGMPGEDGIALSRAVRARGLTLPIVALTGYASAGDRTRLSAAGFAAHLAKPVDPVAFCEAVGAACERDGA